MIFYLIITNRVRAGFSVVYVASQEMSVYPHGLLLRSVWDERQHVWKNIFIPMTELIDVESYQIVDQALSETYLKLYNQYAPNAQGNE